jgi:hypothetical protein
LAAALAGELLYAGPHGRGQKRSHGFLPSRSSVLYFVRMGLERDEVAETMTTTRDMLSIWRDHDAGRGIGNATFANQVRVGTDMNEVYDAKKLSELKVLKAR